MTTIDDRDGAGYFSSFLERRGEGSSVGLAVRLSAAITSSWVAPGSCSSNSLGCLF